MANFTIANRAKTIGDIQRTWNFEVLIPAISEVTQGVMTDVEDLVIRARTATIPERGNEPIASNFMGMQQWFAGKPTFSYSLDVTLEETIGRNGDKENQIVLKSLQAWQNLIFDISPTNPTGGQSLVPLKRDYAKDIYVLMYSHDGTELERKIRFYNAFPKQVGAVTLAYTDSAAVQFPVTFNYDFWQDE